MEFNTNGSEGMEEEVKVAKTLKSQGYSIGELKRRGCTDYSVFHAGYSAKELRYAGYSAKELKEAGYSAEELIEAGYSAHSSDDEYQPDWYRN